MPDESETEGQPEGETMGVAIGLLVVGLALIPGFIARTKGHDFGRWWLFGVFALVPAVVLALIVEEERPCPSCGAKAKISAAFCSSCGKPLPNRRAAETPVDPEVARGMTPMQLEVLRRRAEHKAR